MNGIVWDIIVVLSLRVLQSNELNSSSQNCTTEIKMKEMQVEWGKTKLVE